MPLNPSIYPLDFSFDGRSSNDNPTDTIENAISAIKITSRDTALRQAHTRRISGQHAICNLQKQTVVTFGVLPLYKIGVKTTPVIPFLGTAAFLGGGRGHGGGTSYSYIYRFSFANEYFQQISSRLISPRFYSGTVGNAESGKFCGGTDILAGAVLQVVDKFTLAKQSISRVSATLSEPRFAVIGGMGTSATGILVGGISLNNSPNRDVHLYSHGIDVISQQSNFLPNARFAPHNGLSSQTSGYVWGGSDSSFGGNPLRSIDEIVYSTGTMSGTRIATTPSHAHCVHAAFGNDIAGYVAGGSNVSPVNSNWMSRDITAFTYSGQTANLLSAQLAEAITCADGVGSSVSGFIIGGDTPSSNWNGIRTTSKLRYDTQTVSPVGSTLDQPLADQGAISDYNPGWSV